MPSPLASTCKFLGASTSLGKVKVAVNVDFVPVKEILSKSFSSLLNIPSIKFILFLIEDTFTPPVKANSSFSEMIFISLLVSLLSDQISESIVSCEEILFSLGIFGSSFQDK